ncbi:hypothetical protein [Kitasatospora sp. CB01950]|uniref:hypothetical protein n=1 Tax=Kitasatospora sp. CB01950 TaxID=1703930 RepID=UPI00093B5BCE|nr:hypothetical protein [Kitasatospora sp. CB01950]OKJ05220.1 hypothetical protein AMK19_25790 [Kitasatospora sp. CB01950]
MKTEVMDRKLALVSAARRAVLRLDESERPRLVVLGVGAHTNWLLATVGVIGLMFQEAYYLAVTDRSVYVLRGPRTETGPNRLIHVVPLADAAGLVAKVKLGRTWNSLWLRLPGRRRPVRVKVSVFSRAELDRFLAKL